VEKNKISTAWDYDAIYMKFDTVTVSRVSSVANTVGSFNAFVVVVKRPSKFSIKRSRVQSNVSFENSARREPSK
jgi:hypothetical protein